MKLQIRQNNPNQHTPSKIGTVWHTPSPISTTVPVVRPDA
jgi:hypothetical protein